MRKNIFMLPMMFIRGWAKFSLAKKKLILQKIVSGIDKVVNFKDFSRPNKESQFYRGVHY